MSLADPSDDDLCTFKVLNGNVQLDWGLECLSCSAGDTGCKPCSVGNMNRGESGVLVEAKNQETAARKICERLKGLGD
jgi:hypothetical protein